VNEAPDDILSELRGLLLGAEDAPPTPKTVIMPPEGGTPIALTPAVEEAIQESIRRNPQVLGNALEPAIRAALLGVLGSVLRSPWFWLAVLLILSILVLPIWLLLAPRLDPRFQGYLDKLRNAKGLVVVAAESRPEGYYIAGLRDPLAPDPNQLLAGTGIDPKTVKSRWDDFQASEPDFVLARAKRLLAPPKTVGLNVEDSTLYAKGEAPQSWITKAQTLALFVPGVKKYQASLKALPTPIIQAPTALASSGVVPVPANSIENTLLLFGKGKSRLTLRQQRKVQRVAGELQTFIATAQAQGKSVTIRVVGRADRDGSITRNEALSQRRADYVLGLLQAQGIKGVVAEGLGIEAPIRAERSATDKALNRSVSFVLSVKDTKISLP
jgi:outer membrane protein OmpA-like peptidoglycan-associated protein